MNIKVRLREDGGFEEHECISRREGSQVVFQCPHCDFVRKLDLKSGEVQTSGGSPEVLHEGIYDPYRLLQLSSN